jgi:hypothetical protein
MAAAWGLLVAREAVNIEPERVKLKNLLCYKPSPGNGL